MNVAATDDRLLAAPPCCRCRRPRRGGDGPPCSGRMVLGRSPPPKAPSSLDMDSGALRPSVLDLLAALLTGRGPPEGAAWSLAEDHRHILILLTTSLAVLVGYGVALLMRRSAAAKPREEAAPAPRPLATKPRGEPDPDDGRQRGAVFFGTQTCRRLRRRHRCRGRSPRNRGRSPTRTTAGSGSPSSSARRPAEGFAKIISQEFSDFTYSTQPP